MDPVEPLGRLSLAGATAISPAARVDDRRRRDEDDERERGRSDGHDADGAAARDSGGDGDDDGRPHIDVLA